MHCAIDVYWVDIMCAQWYVITLRVDWVLFFTCLRYSRDIDFILCASVVVPFVVILTRANDSCDIICVACCAHVACCVLSPHHVAELVPGYSLPWCSLAGWLGVRAVLTWFVAGWSFRTSTPARECTCLWYVCKCRSLYLFIYVGRLFLLVLCFRVRLQISSSFITCLKTLCVYLTWGVTVELAC